MSFENIPIGPHAKTYTLLALGFGALMVSDAYLNWGIFAGRKPSVFGLQSGRRAYTLIGRIFRFFAGVVVLIIGLLGAFILTSRHAW